MAANLIENLKGVFKKKHFDEEEYIDQVIEENNNVAPTEVLKSVDVIKYSYDQQKNAKYPVIIKICSFSGDYLPDINSIIWGPDQTHKFLIPYRVVRLDYMEDESEGVSVQHRIMIVVKNADTDSIMSIYS